jgi:REP element-mobilizing transposase RayT
MSRLRRPFLYDRYFFVTVNLLESRCDLKEEDFSRLAVFLARMRDKQRFLLTTWVFLPDHRHAIIYPPHPLSISRVMSALKVSSATAR